MIDVRRETIPTPTNSRFTSLWFHLYASSTNGVVIVSWMAKLKKWMTKRIRRTVRPLRRALFWRCKRKEG